MSLQNGITSQDSMDVGNPPSYDMEEEEEDVVWIENDIPDEDQEDDGAVEDRRNNNSSGGNSHYFNHHQRKRSHREERDDIKNGDERRIYNGTSVCSRDNSNWSSDSRRLNALSRTGVLNEEDGSFDGFAFDFNQPWEKDLRHELDKINYQNRNSKLPASGDLLLLGHNSNGGDYAVPFDGDDFTLYTDTSSTVRSNMVQMVHRVVTDAQGRPATLFQDDSETLGSRSTGAKSQRSCDKVGSDDVANLRSRPKVFAEKNAEPLSTPSLPIRKALIESPKSLSVERDATYHKLCIPYGPGGDHLDMDNDDEVWLKRTPQRPPVRLSEQKGTALGFCPPDSKSLPANHVLDHTNESRPWPGVTSGGKQGVLYRTSSFTEDQHSNSYGPHSMSAPDPLGNANCFCLGYNVVDYWLSPSAKPYPSSAKSYRKKTRAKDSSDGTPAQSCIHPVLDKVDEVPEDTLTVEYEAHVKLRDEMEQRRQQLSQRDYRSFSSSRADPSGAYNGGHRQSHGF